jgi:hypothetical protein
VQTVAGGINYNFLDAEHMKSKLLSDYQCKISSEIEFTSTFQYTTVGWLVQ